MRLLQPEKASSSIVVMELGISTEVVPLQSLNADEPIVFTELGIRTEIRLLQRKNAYFSIVVTEFGISTRDQAGTSVENILPYCFDGVWYFHVG